MVGVTPFLTIFLVLHHPLCGSNSTSHRSQLFTDGYGVFASHDSGPASEGKEAHVGKLGRLTLFR